MNVPISMDIKRLGSPSERGGQSPGFSRRPNFSSFHHEVFTLDVEDGRVAGKAPRFAPLRPRSGSGIPIPRWELCCRTASGEIAGGCALSLPLAEEEPTSPRQIPHPVLGEWVRALRYTGLNWLECGPIVVNPGFSEEGVVAATWAALSVLMKRNDASFLVGTATEGSLALDMALRCKARVLEPLVMGPIRYFLFVE